MVSVKVNRVKNLFLTMNICYHMYYFFLMIPKIIYVKIFKLMERFYCKINIFRPFRKILSENVVIISGEH